MQSRPYHLQKQKLTALLIAVCLLAVLCLSVAFLVKYTDHACSGEGCTVCTELQACTQFLLHTGIPALAVICVSSAFFVLAKNSIQTYFIILFDTPITRKVRMND
ncbi:hypothetical protein [Aminipila luticellarii]|uniref:Uncharacterized protein n=1 Tax=Aminipila luticellarii TaxID=2507160 RepID=A0A410PVH4_9FIRM|nr:hypothetical protein [Aminipila luticellarii]QAT42937.1 hypothetical protein EQM06_06635 [Aminipila luticellarii]